MQSETTTAITAVKQDVRLREWAEQLEAQQASGLTVPQWCAENGIKTKSFYYRLRRVLCTGGRPADGTAAAKCRYPDREERSAYLTADQYHTGYAVGIGECAMLNDLPAGQQVYLITGYTDLRRSIDGLASIIQGQLNLDPFSTALFLFCGRRRDRIKGLLWESDGFLLVYKRLDNGCFQWPRSEMEAKLLTPQQVRWLLEGLKIEQPKAIREGKPGALC